MTRNMTLAAALLLALAGGSFASTSAIEAARSLVASIPSEDRSALLFPYDSPSRTDWHYFPRERSGAPIGGLSDEQRGLLWNLLGSALSETGIEKVKGVLRLEEVLFARENSPGRDPGNFYIAIWGEPSEDSVWGWRFEGHHLSINISYDGPRTVSVTPAFFGANPAVVGEGPWKGFRNLSETEDLARELVLSLPRELRTEAIGDGPLSDVESAGQAQIAPPSREGVSMDALGEERKKQVMDLLEAYAGCFRPEILEDLKLRSVDLASDPALTFQWKGGLQAGDLHTYRIGGESFDIQYANHQSAANHVHVLFRTIGRDFGD